MSKVVGIDLGTTNSLVAYVKDGVPVVIRDASGDGLVPSVVSVGDDGTIHVGREAQRRLLTDARRTVYSVKRFMGKGREDVAHEAEHFPFSVSGEAGGVVRIGLGDKEFTPPEISAFVLRELKQPRRGVLRRAGRVRQRGRPRGDHRAGLLQRRAAHRDARRRANRRPRGAAHHQRADGGVARLRSRQASHRPHRGLRPGRRHVRHLDPEGRGRRLPGALDQRRHSPRRRRHRRAADGHGPERDIFRHRRAALQGRRRGADSGSGPGDPQGRHPGEVGPVRREETDIVVGGAPASGALQAPSDAGRIRAPDRADRRADARAVPSGARRRGPSGVADRRGGPGRRLDAHSAGAPGGRASCSARRRTAS